MNKSILKAAMVFSVIISGSSAFASAVDSCAKDAGTRERIEEEIPKSDRLEVFNAKKEIVGAFNIDPASGDINALYLCGDNVGYYYAKGNAFAGVVALVYSDEYESEVNSKSQGGLVKVTLSNVAFVGDAADADYPPFSTQIFFNNPRK